MITHWVLTVAVAVTGVTVPVLSDKVKVVSAGQVTGTRAGGGLTVTIGVPVQVDGIIRSSTVSSSFLLLSLGTPTNHVHPAPVSHEIVTVGRLVAL